MNVFEINGCTIAAPDADSAFAEYVEDSNGLENVFIGDLIEGEIEEITIEIRRLTEKEILSKTFQCCADGCEVCEDKGDYVYMSAYDLMEQHKEFPCVIAKEI